MPPLIAHWSPGLPSRKPGLRVIVELEAAVEVARRVERRRCGLAVRERVEVRSARRDSAGDRRVPSRAEREPGVRALEREP